LELREHLKTRLPEYLVPALFVELQALPLNANGKVDRAALPVPSAEDLLVSGEYAAPVGPGEELLAQVWSEVLGVPRVGRHDNYFELGGDSLLAIKLKARVHERGWDFELQALFSAPSVAELAPALKPATAEQRLLPFALLSDADRARLPPGLEDAYPMSYMQRGMVFHSDYETRSSLYHDVLTYRLSMPFDHGALGEVLDAVVARHEILRTGLDLAGYGEPLQLVFKEARALLVVDDLRGLDALQQGRYVEQWIAEERYHGFHWREPPLCRFYVHRLSDDEFQLGLSFHHAILDGWSEASLSTEIVGAYAERLAGRTPRRERLAARYAEHIALEQQALRAPAERAFWREQMDGAALTRLGDDPARAGADSAQSVAVELAIPAGLPALARSLGLPLKSVVLAAHVKVLSLLSGALDVVTGIVTHGRPEVPDGDKLVGLFLNSSPLRVRLDHCSWRALIQRIFAAEQTLLAHRHFPLQALLPMLDRPALFEVLFNFTHFHVYAELGADTLAQVTHGQGYVENEFALTVNFTPAANAAGLRGTLAYRSDSYSPSMAAELVRCYGAVWEALLRDLDAPHDDSGFQSAEAARQAALHNATAWVNRREDSALQLFEEQAARTPQALAVRGSGEAWSYAELDLQANRVAHALLRRGLGPEERVGLFMERSPHLLAAMLGIWKARGAYVPLEPGHPPERLARMTAQAGLRLVLSEERSHARLPVGLAADVAVWEREGLEALPTGKPQGRLSGDSLAYVMFTSGSTGVPKGVLGLQRGIVNRVEWMARAYPFALDERLCQKTALSFVDSVWELFGGLLCGVPTEIVSAAETRDPEQLVARLAECGATRLVLVPSLLRALFEAVPHLARRLPRLKLWISSGEALQLSDAERFARELPGRTLLNLYGSTEVAADVLWSEVQPGAAGVSLGGPIDNTTAHVLDAALNPAPTGVPGELYVGGAGLARGYHNDPAATAARFVPDAFASAPGARLYRTGDIVRRRADGTLEYLARRDDQVKVRGFRVALGEIEAALMAQPGVAQGVVIQRAEPGAAARLLAYVEPRPGVRLDPQVLRAALAERLPDYMLPSALTILASLPLTPNGKLDRGALPAPSLLPSQPKVTARTRDEALLAEIWCAVLELPEVSVFDDFFELGGDSLLAVQVISRARVAFDVSLPVRALFDARTVAGLAELLRAPERAAAVHVPIVAAPRDQPLPLSFGQQRLWFLERLQGPSAIYNMPAVLGLAGPLQRDALRASLQQIVDRHEVLRTRIEEHDGLPLQRSAPLSRVALPFVDLQGLPAERADAALERAVQREVRTPFELQGGTLFRARLLCVRPQEHVLILHLHHLVADAWSFGILFDELAAGYDAALDGRPARLPQLDLQYLDFAAWQRSPQQAARMLEHITFWREHLAGLPALLELPTDRPRPVRQSFRGATHTFELGPALGQRLSALGRQHGASLFMTLLAVFELLLSRYSGRADVVVGTPVTNRDRPELERLIGLFFNTLVLRVEVAAASSLHALLRQVRETVLQAFAHQELPFEQLVELLNPPRSTSHPPLFQSLFLLQNAPSGAVALRGLSLGQRGQPTGIAKYDLSLVLSESADGLQAALEYNTDLYDATTAERLAGHYALLLERAVEHPERPVGSLPLLSAAESAQLLGAWNATATPYDAETCLPALIAAVATRQPDAIALVCEGQYLSYGELQRRAGALAGRLVAQGIGPESRVAVCVERSLELVIALNAVWQAGAAYVPADPNFPPARIQHMLTDSGAALLLTTRAGTRPAAGFDGPVLCLDDAWRDGAPAPSPTTTVLGPDHLAYLIYTSGSTGVPKGVSIAHGALVNFLSAIHVLLQPGPNERLLAVTTVAFDIAALELFLPLVSGGQCLLASTRELQDGARLARKLDVEQVTLVQGTPATWRFLLDSGWDRSPELQAICGGEGLPRELAARLTPRVRRLFNLYGPTETTIWSGAYPVGAASDPGPSEPVGRPIANTEFYVLDAQFRPVPVGVVGELYIGGHGLARGYWQRPELTAERFVPDPFGPRAGARLYRTGDLARYLTDGNVSVVGRADQQVKVRGFRIELGEIESVLARLPNVAAGAVLARPDASGVKRLVAYVVPVHGTPPAPSELRAGLLAQLPDYMVPAVFVPMESLPLTPNGKLDRARLPAPELQQQVERHYVAPRTPREHDFAELWAGLLGLTRVGVEDNFFELGGDSIISMRFVARARARGHELEPQQVFEHQTIAQLAAHTRSAAAPPAPHLVEHLTLEWRAPLDPRALRAASSVLDQRPAAHVDLSGLEPRRQRRVARDVGAALARELRQVHGPTRLVAGFDFGPMAPGRLWLGLSRADGAASGLQTAAEELAQAYAQRAQAPVPAEFARAASSDEPLEYVHELDPESTRLLLGEALAAYRTEVEDLLVTALALALGQRGTAGVWIEEAGRVRCVALRPELGPGEALKHAKELRRGTPAVQPPKPDVGLNYFGSWPQGLSGFRLVPDRAPYDGDGPAGGLYLIAAALGGRLQLRFERPRQAPPPLASVAAACVQHLLELVRHCSSPEAGGFTPSDVPESGRSQAEIDALLGSLRE
jgi:amino acid adenylation domain-containing protein